MKIPWHNHANEDEAFFILDGELLFEEVEKRNHLYSKKEIFMWLSGALITAFPLMRYVKLCLLRTNQQPTQALSNLRSPKALWSNSNIFFENSCKKNLPSPD